MAKYFLGSVGTAEAFKRNDNGELELAFVSKTLTDSGLNISTTKDDIRAGQGAPIQFSFYHDTNVEINLTDIQWKHEYLEAQLGVYKKANVPAHRILRELKLDNAKDYEIGKDITCDIFEENDKVDVTGLTRGRGFTGVIQRWNAHRLRMTHGVSLVHRSVGSMGANSTPSRVFKNKHMPGHYGHEQVTIQNLEVVKVDAARNILLIKGCLPGPRGTIVTIKESVKA